MVKVLFAHDHILYKYQNDYYSSGGLSKSSLERYTNVFNELIVLSRQKQVKSIPQKMTKATGKNMTFKAVPNINSLKGFFQIKRVEKSILTTLQKVDAVIVRLPSIIGNITLKIAKKMDIPYLIEVAGCAWDAFWYHSLKGKIMAPIMYITTKNNVKRAPYVHYVTKHFLQNRYPTRGKSINCSNVVLDKINPEILAKRLNRIKTFKLDNTIVLGTIGALDVKYKGQENVIKAISNLKKQGYKLKYHLVGGGNADYLNNIIIEENLIDEVSIKGKMSHEKIYAFFDSLDLYIQPSLTEGLPRSVIEAMSRACPVMGTTAGGIPELVSSGFLFKKNSVKEIEEKLKLISEKTLENEAIRSFEAVKEYDKKVLELRRYNFLKEFYDYSKKQKLN